ncbi:hypothetical protein VAT7223_01581 [Vibrio atlanticus]|uniref:Uncharacterized protein n=1 Tax=Vibrio atlanticus TaxID=693153 RepID=A0A1C3IPF2_9VIBR|nr:hypothetical protein VAT7223_01581 [Vibrio atlanticus]
MFCVVGEILGIKNSKKREEENDHQSEEKTDGEKCPKAL